LSLSAGLTIGIGLCAVLLLLVGKGIAENEPHPPCGSVPWPAYAASGGLPAVHVWTGDELGTGWRPPACTGWHPMPFRLLVAVAGRFRHQGNSEELLARIGAISRLITIRYWSVSNQRWESLVTSAVALDGPDLSQRREDFRVAELAGGTDRYFVQDDNHLAGAVVYRLRVREIGRDRLVVETENVSPMRYLVLTLAGPGDLQSLFFFERLSPEEWDYYGLLRTGAGASAWLGGHEASYVNRAVALFRHFAGLATDQEPPAAP
jgi:hypothetical protein